MIGKESPTSLSGALQNEMVNYNQTHSKSQELKNNKRECELLNPSRADDSTLRAVLREALPFDFWHKIVDEFNDESIDKSVDKVSDVVIDKIIDEVVFRSINEVDEEIADEVISCIEILLSEVESEEFFGFNEGVGDFS